MERKFCTVKNEEVYIEAKFVDIRDGRELINTKRAGYYWHTCSGGPCRKCTKNHEILSDIEDE